MVYRGMPIFVIIRLIRRLKLKKIVRSKFGFVALFFLCMWIFNALLFYYSEHVVAGREDIDLMTSLYWSIITMATIGYGDITPIRGLGWLVAGFAAIMGILAYTLTVSVIADAFLSASIRRTMGMAPLKGKKILVIGDSDACKEIIDELVLNGYGEQVGWLTPTQPKIEPVVDYLIGDLGDENVLKKAGIEKAKHILLCLDNDSQTLHISLIIKHLNKNAEISAIVSSSKTEALLKEIGVKYTVSNRILGRTIASSVFEPLVLSFLNDVISTEGTSDLIQVEIKKKTTVKELETELNNKDQAYKYRTLIVQHRGDIVFIPEQETILIPGDKVVLLKAIK